jgi:hypothetical protein
MGKQRRCRDLDSLIHRDILHALKEEDIGVGLVTRRSVASEDTAEKLRSRRHDTGGWGTGRFSPPRLRRG